MTFSFTTLEQIKEKFDITEDTPEAVRDSLRRKRAAIHLDRNEGKFVNEENEKLFHELAAAIDFIDQKKRSWATSLRVGGY